MNQFFKEMTDRELAEELLDLEWEIKPRQDLWPQVYSKIRFADRAAGRSAAVHRGKNNTWVPFAIAASSVLAVVSILFSSFSLQIARDSQRSQETMILYQQAQLQLIEDQHQMVRTRFVQLLQQGQENLNPAFVAEVQQLMSDVDDAAAQIKAAMQVQPNNTDYASMLVQTYQHELKLLNRVKSSNGLSI